MLSEEIKLVGEVPLGDHAAAAGAHTVHLVAQVARVRVADVGPLATHVRHWNGIDISIFLNYVYTKVTRQLIIIIFYR